MITAYPAQADKVEKIIKVIRPDFPVIDTSKTGTGKTYTALWAAEQLGLKPFVVCPKSAVSVWLEASQDLGIEMDDVVNYEKLRYGTHPRLWTKVTERTATNKKVYKNFTCNWVEPKPELIVFDEAHACSGMTSQTAFLLIRAFQQWIPSLCLTATLADSPLKFKAFGYITKLHGLYNFRQWIEAMGCRLVKRRGWKFCGGRKGLDYMRWIHNTLVDRGQMVQITPEDIPSAMNNGIIIPELREIPDAQRINLLYNTSASKEQFTQARMACERSKADMFIEDAKELLDEGNSVIFFVNFLETVATLRKAFPQAGVITGEEKYRTETIAQFQANEINMLICTSGAGGQSINLHDIHGGHPRVSLISPSYDAFQFIQILGRTVRAGGKSPAIRKIIFAAKTIEQKAYRSVRAKVKRIDTLCDGDLTTFEEGRKAYNVQA